uniref:Uncharacterized protein n=1 Tax=Avena sativa TaxID=4498 RepID=A0ACD5VHJ9_AVESA
MRISKPSFLSEMGYSSEDDSEISDSEIDEYEEKIYERLVSGDFKIRNGENYSCPFCTGKKKKDYTLHNILQHASGVGAAPNRPAKDKATHRALAKHLKNGPAIPPKPQPHPQPQPQPQPQVIAAVEPQPLPNRYEKFVWPWMGVLVNVPTEWKDGRQVGESGNRYATEISCIHIMNAIKSSHLKLATVEQQRVDEDVMKLVRVHKREKQAALNKILKLEQQLEAKQTLELEIQQLKGKLEVMKCMPGHEDSESKDKINKLSEELQDKIDELDSMESLNQTLVIKESQSNIEMQEARKELENRFESTIHICNKSNNPFAVAVSPLVFREHYS